MSGQTFRLAIVQMAVTANKVANLTKAAEKAKFAASKGAQVIALPECFNSPYGNKFFPEYAEQVPEGQTCNALKEIALNNKIYLVGGSIPEIASDGRLYNTSTVWSPSGQLLLKYRKLHLFDIDVPGKITFKESETLAPGSNLGIFTTPFAKFGLGICYDVRFAELAQIYANQGCHVLLYPGAFNMTTGPAHWELLARGRAIDNQLYVSLVSPARDETASYVAWGHSMVVDPWGKAVAQAGAEEAVEFADIDLGYIEQVRSQIPCRNQKRKDLYESAKSM